MVQITKYQQRRRNKQYHMISFATILRLVIFIIATSSYLIYKQQQQQEQNYDSLSTTTIVSSSSSFSSTKTSKCSIYGCIFHPKEWTDPNVKSQIQSIQQQQQQQQLNEEQYGNKNMGGMTQQGKSHTINQDRGIIISPFYIVKPKNIDNYSHPDNDPTERIIMTTTQSLVDDNKNFLIAIFDGHGDTGHDVAQFLQDNFYKRLSYHLSTGIITTSTLQGGDNNGNAKKTNNMELVTPDFIKQKLNQTFVEMDLELPQIKGHAEYNIGDDGGSTASVILRIGPYIYFANVGDSTSFIASYNKSKGEKTKIIHQNRFDKAHLPDEKERIEKLQGHIFIPQGHPMMSRVNAFNPYRNEVVSLAMSRSIGDNGHTKIGVSNEPIIDVLDLNELKKMNRDDDVHYFVVSSSDGLYDHRRPQFVASEFAKCFFVDNEYPTVKSGSIIDLATPKDPMRYLDDITAMALKVEL